MPPTHARHQLSTNQQRQGCSRKSLFICSFVVFALSLLLVNLSFANGFRTMNWGTYLIPTHAKRNVLELNPQPAANSSMELPALDEPPPDKLNMSAQAAAAKQGQQQKEATVYDPLARPKAGSSTAVLQAATEPRKRASTGSSLVIYVFQNKDDEAVRNFEYFLDNGLIESDDVDYVLVVQHLQTVRFVPADVGNRVVVEEYAECIAPWGVYGWALKRYDAPTYKHYVFLTSAVQGPLLPKYMPASKWIDIFTSRLSSSVKMVGPALSCQAVARGGDGSGEWRTNPHITQEMVVLDKEGLEIITNAREVLQCYANTFDAKYHSESGAGRAILEAGKNLDTLMLRYHGVNWQQKENWQCNGGVRPTVDLSLDGISLNPLEVVFVEVNMGFVRNNFMSAQLARKYADWQQRKDLTGNEWLERHWSVKAPKLAVMHARGPGCFDSNFYQKHNPDIQAMNWQPWQLWEHYISFGQFEGRPSRFSCDWAVGRSYMTAYHKYKGAACFDFKYYTDHSPDLQSIDKVGLWNHFVNLGLFEDREYRFSCSVDFMMAGQQVPIGGLKVMLQESKFA